MKTLFDVLSKSIIICILISFSIRSSSYSISPPPAPPPINNNKVIQHRVGIGLDLGTSTTSVAVLNPFKKQINKNDGNTGNSFKLPLVVPLNFERGGSNIKGGLSYSKNSLKSEIVYNLEDNTFTNNAVLEEKNKNNNFWVYKNLKLVIGLNYGDISSEISIDELTNQSSLYLYNKIRMLQDPYPNPFIKTVDGKRIVIKGAVIGH